MDIALLVHALRQQRWAILSFLGAALLAALAGSLATTPLYQAVAVIQLMSRAGQELDVGAVVNYDDAGYLERRDRARTQIQIILSRSVRQEVVRRYIALGHTDIPEGPEGAGIVKEGLSAGPREDTQLVEIRMLYTNPERAAALANLVAAVYQESSLQQRTDTARDTQRWLEVQTDQYQVSLDAASQRLIDFKSEHGLVDIEEKVDDITRRLSSLQNALGASTTDRVLLSSELEEHERLLAMGGSTVLAGMLKDPSLEAMLRQHATIVTQSADVLARYGELHPEHQRAVQHIKGVEALIAQEVWRKIEGERSQIRILERQEVQIKEEMDLVKEELLEKQRQLETFNNLKLEEDRIRRLYASLGEREAEVELQALTRLNNVRLVDEAVPPSRPKKPNVPLNMAMALLVGSVGGVGLALLRHRLDDAILTVQDLHRILDTTLLGVLPSLSADIPEAERGLYAFTHPRSLWAEALRGVREMLYAFTEEGPARRRRVTSSLESEGKSSVAVGLAIAFSRLGALTLVIDADLHRPHLHTVFGLERGAGLVEALTEETGEFPAVTPTRVPNLDLLSCGAEAEHPDELLSSSALARLLTRLSERYSMIIIDSPPTAPVSDGLALARSVDGVLLVVRRGRVSQPRAAKTLKQLRQISARVLGVVFNDVPPSRDAVRYSSAYIDSGETSGRSAET